MSAALEELVFVGFNSRVAALHRENGAVMWQWKSRKGSGYTTVMLDGERLIVSVEGYTYCLEPTTGAELWFNELPGMGSGVATLASVRGVAAGQYGAVEAAASDERRRRSD